jgi:hypothetical protein
MRWRRRRWRLDAARFESRRRSAAKHCAYKRAHRLTNGFANGLAYEFTDPCAHADTGAFADTVSHAFADTVSDTNAHGNAATDDKKHYDAARHNGAV